MNCFKRILPAFIIALFLACSGDFKEITDEERQARLPYSSSSSVDLSSSSSNLGVSSGNSGSSSSDGQSTAERSSSSSSVADGGDSPSSGSISTCGDRLYNTTSHFCFNDAIHGKCDGKTYDAEVEFCLGNEIAPLCGGRKYEAGQECLKGSVIVYCGGEPYYAEDYSCHNGSVLKTYFTDVRDSTRYLSVKIGNQTWMAQNLNYFVSVDGSKCYDNKPENCATYGRLYDWATALNINASCNSETLANCEATLDTQHQGICPEGWHIPSDAEWTILAKNAGGSGTNGTEGPAGKTLKAASGWSNNGNSNGNGTDDFGFSALPGGTGGRIGSSDNFAYIGGAGYWWSSSGVTHGYYRNMDKASSNVRRDLAIKNNRYSVRCLRNGEGS